MEPPTRSGVFHPPTTITVNGYIGSNMWPYFRIDEELFDIVRFVRAWVDPETGKYYETWEIKPREGDEQDNHRSV